MTALPQQHYQHHRHFLHGNTNQSKQPHNSPPMIRGFIFYILTQILVLVCFMSGINGLYPVIKPVHDMLGQIAVPYADVFPFLKMDSVGILLLISLAKTMASLVLFADSIGLMDDCMNGFVTLYLFAIFGGAAYYNVIQKKQEELIVSVALVAILLFRHLIRRPKCQSC